MTGDPAHPVARLIGDELVTPSSAAGMTDDGELFPGAAVLTYPKITHIALAHHPEVHAGIADWW